MRAHAQSTLWKKIMNAEKKKKNRFDIYFLVQILPVLV